MQEIIDDLLCKKIIRPSNSEYASPIVLVKKKDDKRRLCIDYRSWNDLTIKDNFPTPHIEDNIAKLYNKKIFTTLDLKNGYYHVGVSEESIKYTSFVCQLGQFEFLKMPFDLCNAPRVFQRYIHNIFEELRKTGQIIIYLEDFLIASPTPEEHTATLNKVFNIAVRNSLEFR